MIFRTARGCRDNVSWGVKEAGGGGTFASFVCAADEARNELSEARVKAAEKGCSGIRRCARHAAQ